MKKIFFVLTFIFTFFIMALSISAFDVAIEDQNGNTYYHDEYKFYLPSHVSPSEVKLLLGDNTTLSYISTNGEEISVCNGQIIDISSYAYKSNGETTYLVPVKIDSLDGFLILRFASTLPSVYVSTSIGAKDIIEKSLKDTGASSIITNSDGSVEAFDDTQKTEFKIRGNTTRDYAKKPFQLKLPEKADLFGMGKSKTWILLANYLDQSLLRNSVMYQIGAYLGMHTSEFVSVDLYIDGNYYGIYLLCEKVQISKERLNIHELEDDNDLLNTTYDKYSTSVTSGDLIDNTILTQYSYIEGVNNPEDITGGYLVELDNNYYRNELCYFTTENNNHYVIKSPEYASREQVEYIARLFAEMEEAIMSADGYNSIGKHYTDYIDIDSFAAAYIVAELSRNYDAGSSSMYFYKDKDVDGTQSKIFKGPLWDCDNTLGNIHKNNASATEGYWAKNRSIWAGLTSKNEFNQLVSEKFTSAYDYIFDMIDTGGFIDDEVSKLGSSIYMEQKRWGSNDYSKWPLYYDGTHYDRWQSAPVFNFVDTYSRGNNEDYSTVIGYLCEHIEARTNWLADEWGCDVELRERDTTPKPVVPDTPIIPNLPSPSPDETDTETDIVIDTETDSEIDVETETDIEIETGTEEETETEDFLDTDFETDVTTETVGTETSTEDEKLENQPETDMTPDFEEPPRIDDEEEEEKEKNGFFYWLLNTIKSIYNWIRSIFGLPKI